MKYANVYYVWRDEMYYNYLYIIIMFSVCFFKAPTYFSKIIHVAIHSVKPFLASCVCYP